MTAAAEHRALCRDAQGKASSPLGVVLDLLVGDP